MTKRKIDWNLNDIIGSYFMKKKYEKSLKLCDENDDETKNDANEILEKFFCYLKEKTVKENAKEDDLGFEINFGAYQPDTKVSTKMNRN